MSEPWATVSGTVSEHAQVRGTSFWAACASVSETVSCTVSGKYLGIPRARTL